MKRLPWSKIVLINHILVIHQNHWNATPFTILEREISQSTIISLLLSWHALIRNFTCTASLIILLVNKKKNFLPDRDEICIHTICTICAIETLEIGRSLVESKHLHPLHCNVFNIIVNTVLATRESFALKICIVIFKIYIRRNTILFFKMSLKQYLIASFVSLLSPMILHIMPSLFLHLFNL